MFTRSEPTSGPAAQVSAPNAPERRQNLVRILFVNRSLADVERCLHEFKRLRFTVSSDVVLTPEQFAERLRVDVYDTIVAEYPTPNWNETQALDILHEMGLGQSSVIVPVDPVEIEWKRKDYAVLKVRLSGREVQGEQSEVGVYEVIVENITQQRELEDHLRRQAASDPLTGLANYRHLVDVIDSEIKRSKRTNREFALLFFDVDG
jgi:PleD family two-component response regulator